VAVTYKVRLTVTDNRGESRAIDHDVKVTAPPPPNQAPTADFSASCDASLTCTFTDASSDLDGNGTIATWSWDFGVTASPSSSSDKNPSGIVYPTADTYPVTLTVTDNEGATGTITQDVVVP
jgi:PKD repeat protein